MTTATQERPVTDGYFDAFCDTDYSQSGVSEVASRLWVVDSAGEILEYNPSHILPQELNETIQAERPKVSEEVVKAVGADAIRSVSRQGRLSSRTYRRRRMGALAVVAGLVAVPSLAFARIGETASTQQKGAVAYAFENAADATVATHTTTNFQQILESIPASPTQPPLSLEQIAQSVLQQNAQELLSTSPSPTVGVKQTITTERSTKQGLHIEAIGEIGQASAEEVQAVFHYLVTEHKLTPRGAAHVLGNFIWEGGGLDPKAYNPDERAIGLIQAQKGRERGMPTHDIYEQIDWLLDVEAPRDGMSPNLKAVLSDPEASEAQIRNAIYLWIRWGETGERWTYAAQILANLNK